MKLKVFEALTVIILKINQFCINNNLRKKYVQIIKYSKLN